MENALIYQRMCNAMADIEAISKDKFNPQQKFKYRGIDDVMNALFPIFQKHKLFLVPEVLEQHREDRNSKSGGTLIYSILKVRYSLYTDDGSHVSAVVIGEGMDSADKSSNKAMAIAMKYAIFQMFCIPTEDMAKDDPDGYSPDPAPTSAKPQPRAEATKPAAVTKADVFDPRPLIASIKARYNVNDEGFASMRKALVDGGVVENKSSKEMNEADWMALKAAIDANFGDAA